MHGQKCLFTRFFVGLERHALRSGIELGSFLMQQVVKAASGQMRKVHCRFEQDDRQEHGHLVATHGHGELQNSVRRK